MLDGNMKSNHASSGHVNIMEACYDIIMAELMNINRIMEMLIHNLDCPPMESH